MMMSRRLTCDRFYGGTTNRIENLQQFIAHLWRTEPTLNEAAGWLENEFGAESETTRDRYLSFLRGLDLVKRVGGHLYPGSAGVQYLKQPTPTVLFRVLDANVAGFDILIEALAVGGLLTDDQLRQVLNSGPYGHNMDGTGVAVRHREWLQALGFATRADADGGTGTRLTQAGYALWQAFETGEVNAKSIDTDDEEPAFTPLQQIPADPVPGSVGADTEPITYPSALKPQHAATVEHQTALDRLRDRFEAAGFQVRKTRHSDLIAYNNEAAEIFLFEIKSIHDENAWSQVRTAIGQLFEYEYTDVQQRSELMGVVHLALLLSQAPPADLEAYLQYLETNERLSVVWWDDGLAGPAAEFITGVLTDDA